MLLVLGTQAQHTLFKPQEALASLSDRLVQVIRPWSLYTYLEQQWGFTTCADCESHYRRTIDTLPNVFEVFSQFRQRKKPESKFQEELDFSRDESPQVWTRTDSNSPSHVQKGSLKEWYQTGQVHLQRPFVGTPGHGSCNGVGIVKFQSVRQLGFGFTSDYYLP
jgi:hypothetical protein